MLLNELLNTALLGTEKTALELDKLPEILQERLANAAPADREGMLLRAAALCWQYDRTGAEAPILSVSNVEIAPPETRNYAPAMAVRLLDRLLNEETVNLPLLGLWLEKAQAEAWLVQPATLVVLFTIGLDKKAEFLRPALQVVGGNRGKWLVNFHENWRVLQTAPDHEHAWQEGKAAERRAAFHRLRGQDAAAARTQLQTAWPELSARERKDLLDCFRVNLSADDAVFLRGVLQELAQLKDNSKTVNQETKQLIISFLVRIPQSTEQQYLVEQMSSYVLKERKLLLLKKSKLKIPAVPDTFLNAERFCNEWGFSDKNPDAYQFENNCEYWFSEALALTNPEMWLSNLNSDWAGVIQFLKEGERNAKNVQQPARETALQTAAIRFKNAELAFALATELPNQANNDKLLNSLPMPYLEKVFMKLSLPKLINKRDTLLRPEQGWSLEFTRFVLAELFQMVANNNYYQHTSLDFLKRAAVALHPHIETEIGHIPPRSANENAKQTWQEKYVPVLEELLEMRKLIKEMGVHKPSERPNQ